MSILIIEIEDYLPCEADELLRSFLPGNSAYDARD